MPYCNYCSNWPFSLSSITDSDRRECLPAIEFVIKIANIARKEGVLALEQIASEKKDISFTLKLGIELIVDGFDPEIVKDILTDFVKSSHINDGKSNAKTLQRIIETEGLLAVQLGENPYIITLRLLAMLGEDFYLEAVGYMKTKKVDFELAFATYFDALSDGPGSSPLDALLEKIGNAEIQMVLQEIDNFDMSAAMQGLSKKSQNKLCANLSPRLAAQIIDGIKGISKDESEKAMNKFIEIYEKLYKETKK